MARNTVHTLIDSQVCPICKQKFIPAPMHVYTDARYDDVISDRRDHVLVCSWHCRRESERLTDEQTAKRKANKLTKADIKSNVIKEMRHEMQNTAKTKDT